mmetsp:Transcript_29748/g.59716  ORF Transcript_29748/g.59716 Transcript_29748/m.59716 type:complete len:275 (+) Transcript_29748:244-1068(+)
MAAFLSTAPMCAANNCSSASFNFSTASVYSGASGCSSSSSAAPSWSSSWSSSEPPASSSMSSCSAAPPPPPAEARAFTSMGSTTFLSAPALSFTRSAYRSVLMVWSADQAAGLTAATITVMAFFEVKDAFSTCVSFDARNDTCCPSVCMARMHSLRASKLLLISAPSVRSCRLWLLVSCPRSLPARSTTDSIPTSGCVASASPGGCKKIWMMLWLRLEVSLASVLLVVRRAMASSRHPSSSAAVVTATFDSPTMSTSPFGPSITSSRSRLFRRS